MRPLLALMVSLLLAAGASPVWAAHAYAQFGDIKYPPGFAHFDYINPNAPKGGEISLVAPTRVTSFDKYNPFTLKGNAPPGLSGLLFESLLTGNSDEPTTAYGLLAEDVSVAPDGMAATFRLNAAARFANGDPVLAADVKDSFERLVSKQAAPQFRTMYGEVARVVAVDERAVRFEFRRANPELPLIVGGMPVFSRKWGQGKPFDQVITEMPIASGPYRVGRVNFGKDVTYERRTDWWAAKLNVRVGHFNFDRITYKIYKDNTAQLEAFKAGEFDYIQAFIARDWARQFTGRAFDRGEIVKREIRHGNAGDFQGFLINTRRAKFADVRVRQALALAMDYEWMNRMFFYGAYARVRGYFVASDFEARGLPGPDELPLLEPLRTQLPAAVFDQPVPQPPVTEGPGAPPEGLRDNLRQAKRLLAEAGWTYTDGELRNAAGQPFVIEFLDSGGSLGRILTPYVKNLQKLGFRVTQKSVDFALLQKRLDVFDYDITSSRTVGSESPGTELLDRYSSKAAGTEGSANLMGIRDPAVDALLDRAISARTRPELVSALRALDRVLRHGHYSVPHWYSGTFRIAYRNGRFVEPPKVPRYFQPESWIQSTWWPSEANRSAARPLGAASQP